VDGAKDADGILFRFQRKKSEIGMGGAPLAARRHVIWFSHFIFVTKIRCCEESECFFLFVHFGDRFDDETGRPPLAQSKEETNETLFFAIFSLCFSAQIALSQIVVFVYRACERKRKFERSKEEQQQEAGPTNGRI
jgi:hypothetical protein